MVNLDYNLGCEHVSRIINALYLHLTSPNTSKRLRWYTETLVTLSSKLRHQSLPDQRTH